MKGSSRALVYWPIIGTRMEVESSSSRLRRIGLGLLIYLALTGYAGDHFSIDPCFILASSELLLCLWGSRNMSEVYYSILADFSLNSPFFDSSSNSI